jgi:TusA-related sulfurtransferase
VDLGSLGLDGGGHVLVALALARIEPGDELTVDGSHPDLRPQLRAWCSANGHQFDASQHGDVVTVVRRGATANARWSGAERAGSPQPH